LVADEKVVIKQAVLNGSSDLQYVMSNPKSDLVPAKRKLIDIKLIAEMTKS